MKTYKTILISSIIGLLAFPTITLGGSFVSSLIAGKTPEEAVQILAEQLDFLISRVEVVETNQAVLEIEQTELQTQQEGQGQAVADLQAIINQQETIINQQKIEQDKQKACQKANELFKQAEVVYTQGQYRINTAIRVNDFIVSTQTMIDELEQEVLTRIQQLQDCSIKYEQFKKLYEECLAQTQSSPNACQMPNQKALCDKYQRLLDEIPAKIYALQIKYQQLQTINSDFLIQYNLCNEE